MPVERESRATNVSGRATWVVIGIVLALVGSSFAMLPAARAQDEPVPTRGAVEVRAPHSVDAVAHSWICPAVVDPVVAAPDPAEAGCDHVEGVTYVFAYRVFGGYDPETQIAVTIDDTYYRGWFPARVQVNDGPLTIHEYASSALGHPRVFCSRWTASGQARYASTEVDVDAGSKHDRDTWAISTNTENGDRFSCDWLHMAELVLQEPVVEITPPIENPDIVVTPVVPVQLPTSTPAMPQLEVTPPAQLPDPIITPVAPIQLPTPTPTTAPEIGEPPVIVITPVVEDPIEIVTPVVPIVIPVVPTQSPELIHSTSSGGEID